MVPALWRAPPRGAWPWRDLDAHRRDNPDDPSRSPPNDYYILNENPQVRSRRCAQTPSSSYRGPDETGTAYDGAAPRFGITWVPPMASTLNESRVPAFGSGGTGAGR